MKNRLSFSVNRSLLSLLFLVFTSVSFGQLYFGGGVNLIKGFTVKSPYIGLTLMGEKIDDNQSLYANLTMSLNKNEQDQLFPMASSTNLSDTTILGNSTYRYNTLELGRRNYFADDLEFGLGFYLAEHLTISYNTVGINLSNYNTSNYHLPTTIPSKGNILSFAIGGNTGAQYAFFRGVIYGDVGFNYSLVGLPNNITAQNTTSFSQINFTFTLGFKKNLNFNY